MWPQRDRPLDVDRLGVPEDYLAPAFEDPAHWIMKENQLPGNVDASDAKVGTVEQRARIARVFERGLGKPTAFVLPVQRWFAAEKRWASEQWTTRRGR